MPNSVLEALAGGVAVVSTDVGGVPYLVEHRRSALLVPPKNPQAMADAMFLLLGEPDLKERLRQAGLQLADQYTWAQVRPRLLQVYRSVIEKANKAGGPSAAGGSKA
jgi:glycosyltransferase involved in cell wall biosynthesis